MIDALNALVITLREGLEAALVMGLVLVYLKKVGRTDLSKFVYVGLILAGVASGVGAYLFQVLSIQEQQSDIIEAYVMLIGAFFVGTMILWMFKASRSVKRQVEQKIDTVTSKRTVLTQRISLLFLAFVLVFREGVEIILFLATLMFTPGSSPLLVASGATAGIAIAAILGILIIKGLIKINLRLFFIGTGSVLLALIATLIARALHNFAEFSVITLSQDALGFLGNFIRDETQVLILVTLIAVPVLLITIDPIIRRSKKQSPNDESPAKRRLRIAEAKRMKILRAFMSVTLIIVIVSVGIASATSAEAGYFPKAMPVTFQDGKVTVPLSAVNDGLLHKYSVLIQGVTVRFFIFEQNQTVKAALDACYICPPVGYKQVEDTIVCHNCDAPINFEDIGLPGGCNPRVINYSVGASQVAIDETELSSLVKYFIGAPSYEGGD